LILLCFCLLKKHICGKFYCSQPCLFYIFLTSI